MTTKMASAEQVLKMSETFKLLHQHAELSNHEHWTTEFIKQKLTAAGIKVLDYGLKTGVVAEIYGTGDGIKDQKAPKTIALRADIDGLPVKEKTGLAYHSLTAGVAHACGHDFHTAALLGAAEVLKQKQAELNGNVRLVFEPGEENHTGAKMMIKAGVLAGVAAIFGMHNMPFIPCGTVAVKPKALMASNDNFQVVVTGISSHAAMPQTGKDPIVAAANMITALQTIISRSLSPFSTDIVTIGAIHGGQVNNVIPAEVTFKGTIRTFSTQSRKLIKRRFTTIIKQIAAAYDQTAAISWDRGPSPVNNDPHVTELVKQTAAQFMKVIPAEPTCADDDFATYEEVVPGCYAFIGSQGSSNLHHDDLIVDPAGLKDAAELHFQVAKRLLTEQI